MSPLDDTPVKENQPKKSARVLATKKPSKFERKDIITTKSWREGQKLIRRELGPLPKPSVGKKKNQEEKSLGELGCVKCDKFNTHFREQG
jgi:hypothetical protein